MMEKFIQDYKESHQHPLNQLTHAIGIPMIILSGGVMFWNWKWGLAFFIFGWVLQFIGHLIEGKAPAFFKTPLYMLVGPIWWVKKVLGRGAKN